MEVPDTTLGMRIDLAGVQMGKAAWCRNTSIWWGLFGAAFTGLAMDKSAAVYDERLAMGLGALSAMGFAGFQLSGAIHDRRAARLLHRQ